jgi:hypothetical protein
MRGRTCREEFIDEAAADCETEAAEFVVSKDFFDVNRLEGNS